MNIIEKLVEVRKSCSYLKKENKGEQYQYVSSSQTLAALKSKMDELGLLLVPRVIGVNVRESTVEFKDKYDKPKRQTTYFTELNMEYTWMHAEDPTDTIVCTWYGQGVDIAGEKGVGKAMTYAEKYFMLKTFNIPTDKDDPDAFQKKHDDDTDGKPKSNASYDNLEIWIEKFSAEGAKWKDGSLVTTESFRDWYENNSLVTAEKKKLTGETLIKINKLYSQYLDTILDRQERKAA